MKRARETLRLVFEIPRVFCGSSLEVMFSDPPGPCNASAPGSPMRTDSTCSQRIRSVHKIVKTALKVPEVMGVNCLLIILLERFPPGGIGVAWPFLISKFPRVIEMYLGSKSRKSVSAVTTKKPVYELCGMARQRLFYPRTAIATRKGTAMHQSQSAKNVCAAKAESRDMNDCGPETDAKCSTTTKYSRDCSWRQRVQEEKCGVRGVRFSQRGLPLLEAQGPPDPTPS